ncbi:MAG: glycosyltransferase [Bacteroidales bacterium]|nr:glycosyltransferase [Bacteroidales bacterium]
MTLDVLICTFNKGIVRIADVLGTPRKEVRYIVSYQYTEERYLELIPREVHEREDVEFHSFKGQGLSYNRNHALELATADWVCFADDDSRLSEDAYEKIADTFAKYPLMDVAFFRASTYTGKLLKNYPKDERVIDSFPKDYGISTIEMVFRREAVQGRLRFDERVGLGTPFLTCREEDFWLIDALRAGLNIRYFPYRIVETSTMLKRSMLYVDAGVQRAEGAFTYYVYGASAWWRCFWFAANCTRKGLCHFIPMLRHLYEGIAFIRRK